ncbi:hypothetical protein ACVWYG_002214 [Pedobacter sp. UYEF25]
MVLNQIGFLVNEGLYYPAILNGVGKSSNPLQPLFEGLTNAFEAIAQLHSDSRNETVKVKVYYDADLFDDRIMSKLVIEDTGIGFNDEEFKRFLTFQDNRKGYNNRGSGRLQLIHFFSTVQYKSIYKNDGEFKQREFHLSKSAPFLKENAIAYLDSYGKSVSKETSTSLTLSSLIADKDKVSYNMTLVNYKDIILSRYIQYFCAHREALPKIVLEAYKGGDIEETLEITSEDIPAVDSTDYFDLNFQSHKGGSFSQQDKTETFTVQAFKIQKNKLPKNIMTLTSKGEIVDEKDFRMSLNVLGTEDHLDHHRFLFLVSSPYINDRDGDMRGQLRIPRRKDELIIFDEDFIFMDDIETKANDKILSMYAQLAQKAEEKEKRVADLREMFLLNDDYLKNLNISINDTEEKILEKVYAQESKMAAKKDAELKKRFDELVNLNPTAADYDIDLNKIATTLVKEIPHQNRAALTHYVARRKLVLELFDKVLKRQLQMQQLGRNEDEKLLHSLLFAQRTSSADQSDLWILNEDFILFEGVSEAELKNVTIGGQKIFKEIFTADEEKFINANKEKRLSKRPDVLLFPAEEKCIILEFKTPGTNVADHLAEINYYASLILNLTKPEFPFKMFFGYLIGETLEPLDIRFNDSDFINAAHFNFSYRPHKRIIGEFKNFEGALYTEVLKYSTLLERASKRNKVLIDKLFEQNDDNPPF